VRPQPHELREPADHRELVVEVVGDPARQQAERAELLGLKGLRRRPLALVDVPHHGQHPRGAADCRPAERDLDPELLTIRPPRRPLEELGPALRGRVEQIARARRIVRRRRGRQAAEAERGQRLARAAVQDEHAVVDVHEGPVAGVVDADPSWVALKISR
jgi:hypothetical protein